MRFRQHRGLRIISTAALAAMLTLVLIPSAAHAAGSNTLEWWWQKYGVDAAHSAGVTGAGVKVAVIDYQINPDLPVFAGRKLTVSPVQICKEPTNPVSDVANEDSMHGTTMAALIIGNGTGGGAVKGIAPDAEVTFYGYGPSGTDEYCRANTDDDVSAFGYAVKSAVDDGADIVMTSITRGTSASDGPAIAYALARGVTVVAGTPNPGMLADYKTDIGAMNGIVAASAIDQEGNLQQDEGKPLALPQTTVVAAGFDIPSVGVDGDWNGTAARTGSSNSAPIVAGMLALAAQKYPNATGNQLVHSLIATTNGQLHEPEHADDGYGYGAAWLSTLLSNDPGSYPDETPLTGKAAGVPTAEQITTAKTDGFVPVTRPRSFDNYADSDQATGPNLSSILLWSVVGVVVLLVAAAVITVIIVVTQRRKARKGITS